MNKILLSLLIASLLYSQDCAYLPSARRCTLPENCLSNSEVYCSFDFLYWEGTERGLEYALKNTDSFFHQDIEIHEPNFNFEPAFRIGIGTHLPHDNWDLEFAYTRFYNTTSDHVNSGTVGGIQSVWTSSTAFQGNNLRALWQDADAKWKIHTHFFDLSLKHRLCMSSFITLEPSFGLKMALLQQRYSVYYENGNTAAPIQFINSTIAMKNRSFNLGPAATLATRWNVWDHFDFLGSLSGSLLASHFNVGRNESDVMSLSGALSFDSVRERDEYWAFRPEATIAFGFGWSDCVCRPTSVIHYGFSASYEAQVWWKQNMLFRFIDETNTAMIAPTQGDLFFHGLTIDAFVDF